MFTKVLFFSHSWSDVAIFFSVLLLSAKTLKSTILPPQILSIEVFIVYPPWDRPSCYNSITSPSSGTTIPPLYSWAASSA